MDLKWKELLKHSKNWTNCCYTVPKVQNVGKEKSGVAIFHALIFRCTVIQVYIDLPSVITN